MHNDIDGITPEYKRVYIKIIQKENKFTKICILDNNLEEKKRDFVNHFKRKRIVIFVVK